MKHIDTSKLSSDECWSIQINGLDSCKDCKWTGISPCQGTNILKTGYNSKGWKITKNGISDFCITLEEYKSLVNEK